MGLRFAFAGNQSQRNTAASSSSQLQNVFLLKETWNALVDWLIAAAIHAIGYQAINQCLQTKMFPLGNLQLTTHHMEGAQSQQPLQAVQLNNCECRILMQGV